MRRDSLVLLEEDHARLTGILGRLLTDASAKAVFLVNRSGEHITASGDLDGVDPTSLASLTAGNVAATQGLARLLGEQEFSILFHEGVREHLHMSVVPGGAILLVVFDQRSSLGMVRLRVKKIASEIGAVLEENRARSEALHGFPLGSSEAFTGITDEDIDAFFR